MTEGADQGKSVESIKKVCTDIQSGGVRNPNLPRRSSEWVRSRHKPATHSVYRPCD